MNIFWSWQNDSDPQTNRHFIRSALVRATQDAGEAMGLTDAQRPELDHDTKDTPGMVEITNTILRKISNSAVFVADLTPIGNTSQGKALPNPNVLIELGWALSELGEDRIIAILNTANASPDDLPFDIRHRRVLTYNLATKPDKATKQTVRKGLESNLAQSITASLQKFSQDKNANITITGLPSNLENPSIWQYFSGILDYIDTSGQNCSVVVPDGRRGYIRIIPSAWSEDVPTLDNIRNSGPNETVWPVTEGSSSGDYGSCEYGFARFWRTGKDEAKNVSMWFDETGEFWVIHGTAIAEGKKKKPVLNISSLLQGWRQNLRSAMEFFDRLGGPRIIKVEAGLVGIKGVMWPTGLRPFSSQARKGRTINDCQKQEWHDKSQLAFLLDTYNRIRDNFSLPPSTIDDLRKVLQEE